MIREKSVPRFNPSSEREEISLASDQQELLDVLEHVYVEPPDEITEDGGISIDAKLAVLVMKEGGKEVSTVLSAKANPAEGLHIRGRGLDGWPKQTVDYAILSPQVQIIRAKGGSAEHYEGQILEGVRIYPMNVANISRGMRIVIHGRPI